jgi:ABC-type polysaccharide/polyol phosphate export permease
MWIRQFHRWTSIVFTLIPIGIFVALGMGQKPVQWVYYLPLPPLALLAITGLYLFALPYVARWRKA